MFLNKFVCKRKNEWMNIRDGEGEGLCVIANVHRLVDIHIFMWILEIGVRLPGFIENHHFTQNHLHSFPVCL